MLVAMFDCAIKTLIFTFGDFNNLVHSKSVIIFISTSQSAISRWQRYFLAQVHDLDIYNFALLVDHFEIIFVHLQDKTCIFVTIVKN